jgi:zeta-carotene desaturase
MSSSSSSGILKVEGNEGLLDEKRMEKAFLGSGIKIPLDRKLNIGIIGGGLGGMITAMELSEAGHKVEIFEARRFIGGKVGSWIDKDGNHIEMGLHVFFGCYYNLFGIMKRIGAFKNLRLKEHTHTFVNTGGIVKELDFRLGGIGAPFNGLAAFARTGQLEIADKLANAVALATSPVVRALFDFNGALQDIRNLDNISFSEWFIGQGGSRGSIKRMWDPIAYALGFMDCDNTSARCMLTIFQLFAVRTEASVLRMLEGSPEDFLHKPILQYLTDRNVKIHLNQRVLELKYDTDNNGMPVKANGFVTMEAGSQPKEHNFDVIVAATDVPGIQKLLPTSFRKYSFFNNIYNLEAVPVETVQLRFDGWVTELADEVKMREINKDFSNGKAPGLDNLLYSADADFSCFADLALTSPGSYYKEGEGSLLQCVLTPGDKWMPISTEDIAKATLEQVHRLFPSSKNLKCTWWNVVKLGKSLYKESPGMDIYRPNQVTPIPNFFLAGSYTFQDYIDSMEGATKSGLLCSEEILKRNDFLQQFKVKMDSKQDLISL